MAIQTTAVIVNWNGARFLEPLLKSLLGENPARIIVVDNASTDDSGHILSKHPEAYTILNSENVGFAAAANQGIRASSTTYVLLLNVDLTVEPGSLQSMESFMASTPDVGIVAPQLRFPDGTLQPSCRTFPTIYKICMYLSYLDRVIPTGYRLRAKVHHSTMEVDQPMGAALLMRKAAVEEIGMFDESFALYMEEVDLCERLKSAGWRIVYFPEAKVIHHAGGSTEQDWKRSQTKFLASVVRYFRKRSPAAKVLLLKTFLAPTLIFRAFVHFVCNQWRRGEFYFKMAFQQFRL